MSAVQSFYASRVATLTRQLDERAAAAERNGVALSVLRADFDLFRSLEDSLAQAWSTERAASEKLSRKLAKAEGKLESLEAEVPGLRAQAELVGLVRAEAELKEQERLTAIAEMGLATVDRDRAIDDAKEARKAEAKAKLEAHSLQRRLDRSNEVIDSLHLEYYGLLKSHVELTCLQREELVGTNDLLADLSQRQAELRMAALRDRLTDAEKLKKRYQRQVDVLCAESYMSGWENREFEGHPEVVTPDQFDGQKDVEKDHYSVGYYMQRLGSEIDITYPADVLKMLDEEKDGPSASAFAGKELVPVVSQGAPPTGLPLPGLGAIELSSGSEPEPEMSSLAEANTPSSSLGK